MAGAQKKVILRLLSGDAVSGYLPASGFVTAEHVALMDLQGRSISFPLNQVKMVCYVRDFHSGNPADPEQLGKKLYPTRPRAEGVWLRLTFREGDVLEGLAATDVTFLDSLLMDACLSIVPPDARSNTQRISIPRAALQSVDFLGVILPAARRATPGKPVQEPQPWLFGDE